MKHVSIIIPEADLVLSSVIGPYKIFRQINLYLEQLGRPPFYDIKLVSVNSLKTDLYDNHFGIRADCSIHDVPETDLIVLPAFTNNPAACLEINQDLSKWLTYQYKSNGAEIASLCMGAFFLGATGLIDGKIASTHWMGAEAFQAMFPKVKLKAERIVTEESGLYTSGGAYSFLNLILHLVEKFNGRDLAIMISKLMEIDISRNNQSPFVIFSSQKDHNDDSIRKAQEFIEENYQEKISVEMLAGKFALSRRNFIRRFKNATQNTPIEYIQRVRVEAAKKMLEKSTMNISEVLESVGYSDDKAFRQVFKKFSGLSPNAYKSRYNKSATAIA